MSKKILVMDDEQGVLLLLRTRFEKAGYEVFTADTGKEALEIAKNRHPDIIILDIIMPDIDGGKIAEMLKEDHSTRDIPIVFLTCLITKKEEDAKGVHQMGGKYFIAKPYDPEEVLEVIKKHLG